MLGQNIREALVAKKMTSSTLADALGISKTHLSYIMNGKRNPSLELLEKISNILDVRVSDILNSQPTPTKKDQDLPDLNEKDEKDIAKMLEEMKERLMQEQGLMFDGDPASPESIQSILDAMQIGMEMAKKRNKAKYTPKKYRKE